MALGKDPHNDKVTRGHQHVGKKKNKKKQKNKKKKTQTWNNVIKSRASKIGQRPVQRLDYSYAIPVNQSFLLKAGRVLYHPVQ